MSRLYDLELGPVRMDFSSLMAWSGSKQIDRTHREFENLRSLAERPNAIVHRGGLLRKVWGYQHDPGTRAADNAIARLRKKDEKNTRHPQFIHSVHGDGDMPATGKK